jgi:PIN domain nuclease of toxin-antitoxin system
VQEGSLRPARADPSPAPWTSQLATRTSNRPTRTSATCSQLHTPGLSLSASRVEAMRRNLGLGSRGSRVADAAVADTHALIFHAAGGGRLGRAAQVHFDACEQQKALLYVPVAVIWEVTLLARAVRINLRRSSREFFDDLFSNPAYQPVDLAPEQVLLADEFRFTRDPFDALIVACAQDLALPLVTRDTAIRESGTVRVIW